MFLCFYAGFTIVFSQYIIFCQLCTLISKPSLSSWPFGLFHVWPVLEIAAINIYVHPALCLPRITSLEDIPKDGISFYQSL